MKSQLVVLFSGLIATIKASPNPNTFVPREHCNHPGECGWFNSGQCGYHCDGYGGYEHMQSCGWVRKRCCCRKDTDE